MKKFFRLAVGLLLSVALFSCSKDDDESEKNGQSVDALTYEYDALIINQGNYSESNGSVSLWKNNQVVNQVYENANGGEKLASIIESAVDCGTHGLCCATMQTKSSGATRQLSRAWVC